MSSDATGFWSYAHADNEATGGQIRRLAKEIAQLYRFLTGDELQIFMDRDEDNGLKWGQEWRKRITDTIAGTTFFIPIITPTYLGRPNCRDEFFEFWDKAKGSEVGDLLLPIVYSDRVDLGEETEDEICQIVRKIHSEFWTDTWLEDATSSKYRRGVKDLAERIAEIAAEVSDKPEVILPPGDTDSDDSPPGLFDTWADAEARMAGSGETISKLKNAMAQSSDVINATPQLQPNASANARLIAIKALANKLTAPALDFKTAAKDIETTFRTISTAVDTMVEFVRNSGLGSEDALRLNEIEGQVATLKRQLTFNEATRDSLQRLNGLASLSRDMKKPISAFDAGFKSLDTAFSMVSRWQDQIAAVADQ